MAVFVGDLTWRAPALREDPPAATRLAIGSDWMRVTLAPFRRTPLLLLAGEGAFGLRIDGERVVRVGPGESITLGTRLLRSLELRARPRTVVTLTPVPEP